MTKQTLCELELYSVVTEVSIPESVWPAITMFPLQTQQDRLKTKNLKHQRDT